MLLAEKIMERIYKDLSIFEKFSKAGWPHEGREKHRIFYIFDGRYAALYLFYEKKRQVEIIGIFSAQSDWRRHLGRYFRTRKRN